MRRHALELRGGHAQRAERKTRDTRGRRAHRQNVGDARRAPLGAGRDDPRWRLRRAAERSSTRHYGLVGVATRVRLVGVDGGEHAGRAPSGLNAWRLVRQVRHTTLPSNETARKDAGGLTLLILVADNVRAVIRADNPHQPRVVHVRQTTSRLDHATYFLRELPLARRATTHRRPETLTRRRGGPVLGRL